MERKRVHGIYKDSHIQEISQFRLALLLEESESLSNTPFQITRRISLYLELISGKRGDRTSIIVTVALCANHYSTRAEILLLSANFQSSCDMSQLSL